MQPPLRSKHHIPEPKAAPLIRPRLSALLDAGANVPLTLISAPAGYGKSTLVAAWLRANGGGLHRPAWYALDRSDNHGAVFLTRLIYAVRTVSPDFGGDILLLLQHESLPFEQACQLLLAACLELPAPVVLVLDDYHYITIPPIHTLVQQIVQYGGPYFRLIVLTRHDPPLKLARWRAEQRMVEIRQRDLRFTIPEAHAFLAAFFAATPQVNVPTEVVAGLTTRTEGWIAGLQLSAIALQGGLDPTHFLSAFDRRATQFILDYLVDEVLDLQPPAVQQFLMVTSVLSRFNVSLAATITGQDEATCARTVAQLRRDNLFVIDLDAAGDWCRYHHQFQHTLRSRLQMQAVPQQIDGLRHAAAKWFEAHGEYDDAFALLVELGAWAHVTALVERSLARFQHAEDWGGLSHWLDAIPPLWLEQNPTLLVARAWISNIRGDAVLVNSLAARAEEIVQAQATAGSDALLGQISALRSSRSNFSVSLTRRNEYATAAIAQLPPEYGWVRGFAYLQLAQNLSDSGKAADAYRLLDVAVAALDPADTCLGVRLHQARLVLDVIGGRLNMAEAGAVRFLELAEIQQMPFSIAWARVALGVLAFERGELARALPDLLFAIDYRHPVHFVCRAYALAYLVLLCAFQGTLPVIAGELRELRSHFAALGRPEQVALLDAVLARIALTAGELSPAEVAALPARIEAAGIASGTIHAALPALRLLLAVGTPAALELGVAAAQMQVEKCRRSYDIGYLVQFSIELALLHSARNAREPALEALEAAIVAGCANGYRWSFLVRGPDVARLLYELIAAGRCTKDAGALLAEFPAASPAARQGITTRLANRRLAQELAGEGADGTPSTVSGRSAIVEPLTNRELEVLELLHLRLSNKEIAYKLTISPFTVRNQTASIYAKLNVHSRAEAVARAADLGLLTTS